MKHLISIILSILLVAGGLAVAHAALGGPEPSTGGSPQAPASAPASAGSATVAPGAALNGPGAVAVLNTLPVKGRAPETGYDRNREFGNGWKDFDGNKCDERQDTLKRDLSAVKYKDAKKCQLASGNLADPYTGKTITWKVNSGSVDIDHVVALKNAWVSGAQQLSLVQRQQLANDPLNLMASQASANRSKGDANAAEWLPTNKPFRCQYVATQISVKKKYALAVTAAEKDAMARVLSACPTQKAAAASPLEPQAEAPDIAPGNTAAPKRVSPGAYCPLAEQGTAGIGKTNGKSYTCKPGSSDTLLRWR